MEKISHFGPNLFLMKKIFLISFVFIFTNCGNNKPDSIKCICEFIKTKVSEQDITHFTTMEGVNVWREGWSDFTDEFEEEFQPLEDCEVNKYLIENYETHLGELKGQMLFVFSVHSFFKHRIVIKEEIEKEVLKILD